MTRIQHLEMAIHYTNCALVWLGMGTAPSNVELYKAEARFHFSFVREGR